MNINDAETVILVQKLASLPHLRMLNLSNNHIQKKGAHILIEAFAQNLSHKSELSDFFSIWLKPYDVLSQWMLLSQPFEDDIPTELEQLIVNEYAGCFFPTEHLPSCWRFRSEYKDNFLNLFQETKKVFYDTAQEYSYPVSSHIIQELNGITQIFERGVR